MTDAPQRTILHSATSTDRPNRTEPADTLTSEVTPLGRAPRPTDGTDLATRIRTILTTTLGSQATGFDRAPITTLLDGADVASVNIDLSHVVVPLHHMTGPGTQHRVTDTTSAIKRWNTTVVHHEVGTLHSLRVEAHPLKVVDLPVDITAELEGLHFTWVEGADGSLGIQPASRVGHTISGYAQIAIDRDAFAATVRGLLTVVLQQQGVTLTDLTLNVVSHTLHTATLQIDAGIKKGMFLSARVQAAASINLTPDMILTVGNVHLSSTNPLVSALLTTVKSRIEAATRQTIDLTAALPEGVRLVDVQLDSGQQLRVNARLA